MWVLGGGRTGLTSHTRAWTERLERKSSRKQFLKPRGMGSALPQLVQGKVLLEADTWRMGEGGDRFSSPDLLLSNGKFPGSLLLTAKVKINQKQEQAAGDFHPTGSRKHMSFATP